MDVKDTLFLLLIIQLADTQGQVINLTPLVPAYCNPSYVPDFQIDTALLTVVNDGSGKLGTDLDVYKQSSECHNCPLQSVAIVLKNSNCSLLVDTRWPVMIEIEGLNMSQVSPSCSAANNTHHFLEKGLYVLFVQISNVVNGTGLTMQCNFAGPLNEPPDSNIPIYVAFGILLFLAITWIIVTYLYRRGHFHRILCFWSTEGVMSDLGTPTSINPTEETAQTNTNTSSEKDKVKKERLRSLDAFRGISLVIMIFVNYRGGYYWFFRHAKWNGLTVADLVFPWFVFIMGTAMMLSFQGQLRHNESKLSMLGRIVRRSIILFSLGLLINSDPSGDGVDLSNFRIPGVLQRFACTYLVVASVHLLFAKPFDENRYQKLAAVRDIIDFWPEWLFHLMLVAVQISVTFGLKFDDCPVGYLGPGGLADNGSYTNCTGGAAGYIDRIVFGENHIYNYPTCKEIYKTQIPYDPEGLLGTLTSIFMCFLGLQAGKILFIHKDWVQRFVRFAIWGIMLGLIAGVLCKFSKNDGWIPLNKNLWSLSFVLALAGMAFILLMSCYLLIDVYKIWNGAPFYYPGMNPILLYVGHELLSGRFPVAFDVPSTHAAQLAMNIWGATFWVLVAYYLYWKGIFISV